MTDIKLIERYILQPFPLWNAEISRLVVDHKWKELHQNLFNEECDYSIGGCVLKNNDVRETCIPLDETNGKIQIALPSDNLSAFYKKHGLNPLHIKLQQQNSKKVKSAMAILKCVPDVHCFILQIVKSMQLIHAEDPETDISYSHPDIPFSIFFSVCEEVSTISDFRVAESILHEAMHLYLTLIEDIIPVIHPDPKGLYFSPWRDEPRPARGVLHGLFVFRSLFDFFTTIRNTNVFRNEEDYIDLRIKDVANDISQLQDFASCPDLTKNGAILTTNLLPLN